MNSYLNFFFFVLKDDDERAPSMMKNFRKIEQSYSVNGARVGSPHLFIMKLKVIRTNYFSY